MSIDIPQQLRELAEYQRATRRPVEIEELELADASARKVRPKRPLSGPLVALAVALAVLLVFVGLSLLVNTPGNDPVEPEPSSTTTSIDADSPEPPANPLRETLTTLETVLGRDAVLGSEGYDVKVELEYIYQYLSAEDPWPEPRFDVSALGEELILREATVDDEFLTSFASEPGFLSPPYSDGTPEEGTVPLLVGAQLEGTSDALVFAIVFRFQEEVVDVRWRMAFRDGTLNFGPRGPTEDWPGHIILVSGADRPDVPIGIGGLPIGASVVTTTYADGTSVWQRPASGIVVFDDPGRSCITEEDAEACEGEYVVLDVAGGELMRIVLVPIDDLPPFGFRVDRP